MEFAREDLLEVRNRLSTNGVEMTPIELEEMLQEVRPDLVVTDDPGLVSEMRELKNNERWKDI